MAERTNRQGFGALGVGAVACAACCAGPVIGLLAAASIGTLLGVTLFGVVGLTVVVVAVVVYLRGRPRLHRQGSASVPVPVEITRMTGG